MNLPFDGTVLEMTLRVHRGLYIRGEVLDASSHPVDSAQVWAYCKPPAKGSRDVFTDEEGRFILGPLIPGRYILQGKDDFLTSSEVEASAGDENIVIRMDPCASLRGRISLEAPQDLSDAVVWLFSREAGMLGGTGVNGNGTFLFQKLKPGLYNLCARLDDRWIGIHSGASARADGNSEEVLIPLEPAAVLVLRFRHYDDSTYSYRLESREIQIGSNVVRADGTETESVPAGWTKVTIFRENEEIASKGFFLQAKERREWTFDRADQPLGGS